MKPYPLSLADFVEFSEHGTVEKSLNFLRTEILIRLANAACEMTHLPQGLQGQTMFMRIASQYEKSFSEAVRFSQVDFADSSVQDDYCDTLTQIRHRHLDVIENMAEAVASYRSESAYGRIHSSDRRRDEWRVQYFLERFFMGRIGRRMLINQHMLVFGGELPRRPGLAGELH
jgi:pyruvate dehydrogenase kinase 2/3/4